MSRSLTVSRAAQLVGVSRAVLQRMIRAGELIQSEGLVDIDELLRAFPDARVEESGILERVTRIREEAFGRRVREFVLPSPELLSQRLLAQGEELAEMRRHLQAYHALVAAAIELLARRPASAALADEARETLERGLAQVLGSESDNRLDAMTDMLKVVSANVVVRPSGREFLVQGNDSILQAGLKAGLGLNYGCAGGNCGLCKARVISGETRQILHSDYSLSAAERTQGYLLLCAHTAVSDLVIETLEAGSPADIPEQELVARVRALQPLGPNTMLLHLQAPRSARLRFLAGQSVTLGLAQRGGDLHATWPIASCPCDERNLHFHVARDAGDALAERLFAGAVKSGDTLGVHGPSGDFVLGPEMHSEYEALLPCRRLAKAAHFPAFRFNLIAVSSCGFRLPPPHVFSISPAFARSTQTSLTLVSLNMNACNSRTTTAENGSGPIDRTAANKSLAAMFFCSSTISSIVAS